MKIVIVFRVSGGFLLQYSGEVWVEIGLISDQEKLNSVIHF